MLQILTISLFYTMKLRFTVHTQMGSAQHLHGPQEPVVCWVTLKTTVQRVGTLLKYYVCSWLCTVTKFQCINDWSLRNIELYPTAMTTIFL